MSTNPISSTSSGPTVDRSYFACTRMIIVRVLNLIFPLVAVVLHGVTLGLNNSSPASDLPENAVSSNESDRLYLYNSTFLTRSLNTFCGIWLGLCCHAVIYHAIVLGIISMKMTDINYQRLLKWDMGLNTLFMWIFIDGAAGSFLMAFLWSAYNGATDLEGAPASIARAIVAVLYIAVAVFIVCVFITTHYYSVVIQTISIYVSRNGSINSCGTSYGTQLSKDVPKDVPKDSEETF